MSMTITAFVQELRTLRAEVATQLAQRAAGVAGDGTVGELQQIDAELRALETRLASGQLPPKDERWLGATRIVTDTWPFESKLGQHILKLADRYKRRLGA